MSHSSTHSFPLAALAALGSKGTAQEGFSVLVTFDRGQVHVSPLNSRLVKSDVARFLKTTEDGVTYLVEKKQLKVLGKPTGKQQRYFSASEIFANMQDTRWLAKTTDLLYEFVEEKNRAHSARAKQSVSTEARA